MLLLLSLNIVEDGKTHSYKAVH